MSKEILPFSYLVLYAKHWIKFPWIKYDNKQDNYEECIYKELKIILRMCGYYPVRKDDIHNLMLIAVDDIIKVFKKHNIKIPVSLSDHYHFIYESKRYESLYDVKTFDLAMCLFILSELSMLEINNFAVKYIDYAKYKIRTGYYAQGMTYKQMQMKFNKMFKDLLIPESFSQDYYPNLKDI